MSERKSLPVRLNIDRAISILIIIALVGAVVALGWVITHPVEEEFTEFYILGPERMADDYPSELAVGEEGTVFLGITNREHHLTPYQVEMTVEGIPEETIGPLELEHEENWEEEVSFAPHEACAHTKLAEMVDPGTGAYAVEIRSIEVYSTEHLKPGDYIWISWGKEQGQVDSINGNTVHLVKKLNEFHNKSALVTESQKVEFKLYKTRQLAGHTTLSLWLGRENLAAAITNQSQSEAEYRIEVKVKARIEEEDDDEESEETNFYSTGPVTLKPGSSWEPEFSYLYPGAIWQNAEMSLFREGELIYQEDALGGYPALHLWIETLEEKR